jgi:RNA polymerase sigma-70 factor (ECF subfamily)
MSDAPIDTKQLHRCVAGWQAGNPAAADELFRAVQKRLEHLTRRMLNGFWWVRDSAETADVLQNSMFRLLNTLRHLQPESTLHFFNLAALHIRRELIDLARRFRGEAFARSTAADAAGESLKQRAEAPEKDLDLWCGFHEAVDQLPDPEREVIGLTFYHGWTQVQIAELLQVDVRTVRRRWQSACLQLRKLVDGDLPQS